MVLNQPGVLGREYANVATNLNAVYLSNAVDEQPMYGKFAIGSICDWPRTIEFVDVQCRHEDSIYGVKLF